MKVFDELEGKMKTARFKTGKMYRTRAAGVIYSIDFLKDLATLPRDDFIREYKVTSKKVFYGLTSRMERKYANAREILMKFNPKFRFGVTGSHDDVPPPEDGVWYRGYFLAPDAVERFKHVLEKRAARGWDICDFSSKIRKGEESW